jgi:hypothetical protein
VPADAAIRRKMIQWRSCDWHMHVRDARRGDKVLHHACAGATIRHSDYASGRAASNRIWSRGLVHCTHHPRVGASPVVGRRCRTASRPPQDRFRVHRRNTSIVPPNHRGRRHQARARQRGGAVPAACRRRRCPITEVICELFTSIMRAHRTRRSATPVNRRRQ